MASKYLKDDRIQVSVICLVYNHEKNLRKCLDGFVNQKTNFRYEVLVHDDNSLDNSQEIIKEYYHKYPDIIKPILQHENQYSLGVSINKTYILPNVKGKYIAHCEGDDYWCDDNKLQLQYDYMENHPNCSICLHNTVIHDLEGKTKDRLFNNWKVVHVMTEEEIFCQWKVHTSSFFYRRNSKPIPDFNMKFWFGDFVRLTWMYSQGEVVVLPYVMSVYNYRNKNSVMTTVDNLPTQEKVKKFFQRVTYLEKYNIITEYKFDTIIQKRIREITFYCFVLEKSEFIKNSNNKAEVVKTAKSIIQHPFYQEYIRKRRGIFLVKSLFKYHGYIMYPIWKFMYKFV